MQHCKNHLPNCFGGLFWYQELKGLKDGEEAEDGAGEEGVTFDVWKKTEMPPPAEPVYDEVRLKISPRHIWDLHSRRNSYSPHVTHLLFVGIFGHRWPPFAVNG